MARTTGRSGFKMRSGNTSTFKMMGSSPAKQTEDTPQSRKFQKQQNIALTDEESLALLGEVQEGGEWRETGRPRKYKTLMPDGTYKVVTNPSGSQSKTADELRDTFVTDVEAAEKKEQDVQDIVSDINVKTAKKQERRAGKKKTVKKIKDFITGKGAGGRKERKRKKDYDKQVAKDKEAPTPKSEPTDEYLAYQESLKPGGANYKGGE